MADQGTITAIRRRLSMLRGAADVYSRSEQSRLDKETRGIDTVAGHVAGGRASRILRDAVTVLASAKEADFYNASSGTAVRTQSDRDFIDQLYNDVLTGKELDRPAVNSALDSVYASDPVPDSPELSGSLEAVFGELDWASDAPVQGQV